MIYENRDASPVFDPEQLTDLEIAIYFLRLFDNHGVVRRNLICGMAENALKNMTNPFAKKMLVEKMTEH